MKTPKTETIHQDVIQQWEIEALLGANRAVNQIAYSLRKRLDAGATVEGGKWELEADALETFGAEEMQDIQLGYTPVAGLEINERRARRTAA